jgi:hypothetical protein
VSALMYLRQTHYKTKYIESRSATSDIIDEKSLVLGIYRIMRILKEASFAVQFRMVVATHGY